VKEDLNWCHPFSKFMSIKGVVFLTFWQSVFISFVAHAVYKGRDDANASKDATEWSKEAQDFLICFEMFAFAIIHSQVFPTEEWEPGFREKQKRRIKATFGDSLAIKDFVADVKTVMRSRRKGKYKKVHTKKILVDSNYSDENYDASTISSSLVCDSLTTSSRETFEIGDISEHSSDEDGWNRIEEFIDEIEDVDADARDNDDDCMLPNIA